MSTTYVYFIQARYGAIKIGHSSDPEARLRCLQTGTSKPLRLIAKFPFESRAEAAGLERELHRKLHKYRCRGEWFRPSIIRAMKCKGKRIIGGTHKNPIPIYDRVSQPG